MGLPSVEPAMAAARRYLCAKAPDPADLAAFRVAVKALRVSRATIEADVGRKVTDAHNSGRIKPDHVEPMKAALLQYGLGHETRMRTVLSGFVASGLPERSQALVTILKEK